MCGIEILSHQLCLDIYSRYGFVTFRTAEEARKVQEMVCLSSVSVFKDCNTELQKLFLKYVMLC